MPDWGSFGQQRPYFVDPMEPAPLFSNPRGHYTQVVNLDDFRVPDVHHSPLINSSWDILGVPEAEENDDHVCPSILPPEAVRDAQTTLTVPGHDHHDEAVRIPSRELMINTQQLHTLPRPVDARWLSLRTQQGRDFAQRDALCINVGGNFVDNAMDKPVDNECQQHYFASSEIEVPSQEQLQTTPPPASATTSANSDGVGVRQHKQTTVEATKRTQQKNKRCPERSVLGLRKTVNARLKKKAPTTRIPASQRGSHILLESGRLRAMIAHHETLREVFQLEKSEIFARTNKASVVSEPTNRIVSLEGWVKEIPAELTTAHQSRNLNAMPPAYLTANVRVHVSGLGEMEITIHSLEEARQLYHLFHEFVSGVIDSSRYYGPDMLHLDMTTVSFAASYTLHSQTNPGSDFAGDELHTTLQVVVKCDVYRTH